MDNKWDEQYRIEEYRYGETPNLFFKEVIDTLPVGKILLPADGEGRNGVYAAKTGWETDSFDQSSRGREKALRLAEKNNVSLSYKVMGFEDVTENYMPDSYDVIALIYVHLPLPVKEKYHKSLLPLLRKGGYVIIEGFNKGQRQNQLENPMAGFNTPYSLYRLSRVFN